MRERIETTPASIPLANEFAVGISSFWKEIFKMSNDWYRLQLLLSDVIRVARGCLGLNDNYAPQVVRPRTYCERFFDNCHRGSVPVGRLIVINAPKED